jgi:hypothetical protein
MDSVVVGRQDETPALEPAHHRAGIIGMRPFMELVRGEHGHAQGEHECHHEHTGARLGREESHCREHRRGGDAVVAIRLNEVVPGDLTRVRVMLAEWANEVLAEQRRVDRSPRVEHPVDDTGHEIGGDVASKRRYGDDPSAGREVDDGEASAEVERERCEHEDACDLEPAMSARVSLGCRQRERRHGRWSDGWVAG